MVVWLKNPDGTCVRLIDKWKPEIHVGGKYRDLVAKIAITRFALGCWEERVVSFRADKGSHRSGSANRTAKADHEILPNPDLNLS
jgi:hypothetical protein